MNKRTISFDEEMIGDLGAKKGSRAWAIAVRNKIDKGLREVDHESTLLESYTSLMRQHHGYESLGFDSFEEFCESDSFPGLGRTVDEIDQAIKDRAKYHADKTKPAQPHGSNQHSGGPYGHKVLNQHGTSNEYLAARIARDRPDILERMKAGEFQSVQAAAREAGFVKKDTRFRISGEDMEQAARQIKKHLTEDQIKELVTIITT